MATSRSCTKHLKGTVKFLLYLVVEVLQLVHEIAVFPRCSIKEEMLYKNFVFIASLGPSPISEILILKIKMLLAFQNKTNIEIIGF